MSSKGMEIFLQLFISGLALGGIYALVALGFVLIYKSTGVLNFAQGELMMIGAFVCFSFMNLKIPFYIAIIMTLIVSATLGFLIERIFLRPMVGKPIFAVVMITIGLSEMAQSIVEIFWTAEDRVFENPFPKEVISFGGIVISQAQITVIIVATLIMMGFSLFFKYSRLGIAMRATAFDQKSAQLMGISPKRIFGFSWAISSVIATIGGVLLASITWLSIKLGSAGIRSIPAAVVGGLDSTSGSFIGGFILGIIETLAGGYLDRLLGGGIKEITAYAILLLILFIRPYGLFGTKEIERV
jgi:branched-chain amino acid transport system permease protein